MCRTLQSPRAAGRLAAFAVIVVAYLAQASSFWPEAIDDAYIAFRYALNLSQGHGLTYNATDSPVEGFTNLSWVLLVAAALRLGVDAMFAAKLLGLASGILVLSSTWAFSRLLRSRDDVWNLLAPAFVALNSSAARWALLGLETQFAVLLIVYAYYRFAKEIRQPQARLLSPWIALLAALTRFDSLFYLIPLGVYGLAAMVLRRVGWRRFAAGALAASLCLGVYFGWKLWYFGDPLPNTYYAKHRMVSDVERARGKVQLEAFYLEHGTAHEEGEQRTPGAAQPQTPSREAAPAGAWQRVRRILSHEAWWTIWWVAGALLLVLLPRVETWILVLLPCLLNAYYVYYNDGDWMPSFRFFQVVIPFLALLGPLAIGRLQDATAGGRRWLRAPACAVFVASLIGVSVNETGWASVSFQLDRLDPKWFPRQAGWWRLDSIRKNYRKGFAVPLKRVATHLLLETQDAATIYMGDIGWPMWLAHHLTCVPVEGLTDKVLGDAPSVRGDRRSIDEHVKAAAAQLAASSSGDESPEWRAREIRRVANRSYEGEHIPRNVEYVLRERRPEYLLMFQLYPESDAKGTPRVYPELSRAIYETPERESEYQVAWQLRKFQNAYTTLYRRKDVPATVPDAEKVARLSRALELNPRVPELKLVLYRQMRGMEPGTARERARALLLESVEQLDGDEDGAWSLWREMNRERDEEMLDLVVERLLVHAPREHFSLRFQAARAWKHGRHDQALEALEQAIRRASWADTEAHHELRRYYQRLGRRQDALRVARLAVRHRPADLRGWVELAQLTDASARESTIDPTSALALSREALEAYARAIELGGESVRQRYARAASALTERIEQLQRSTAR